MAPRRPRNKPKQQCTKHRMPWGYDAPFKDTTPLNDFIKYITDPQVKPARAGEMKNVLVYWDRGNENTGDEAKMIEMGTDSNVDFAHIIDAQDWVQVEFEKGENGNDKHRLEEAAEIFKIDTITQRELDDLNEAQRDHKSGAMIHNAGGDAEITLRVFIALILLRIKELNDEDGGERKLRNDFCFIGLDFEGGGKIGKGTTEIGLSKVFSQQIDAEAGEKGLKFETRHTIISENFDDHPRREAQNGKMAIDDRESKSYPRWNFQGGPNGKKREDYCYNVSKRHEYHQVLTISIDTEIIDRDNMAWWILHQVPQSSASTAAPTSWHRCLVKRADCWHGKHETKARERDANNRLVYPIAQTRAQKKAAEWAAQDYEM